MGRWLKGVFPVSIGLVVTALACLLISPLGSLTCGVAILPFSWPFLAMLPAMLLLASRTGVQHISGMTTGVLEGHLTLQ